MVHELIKASGLLEFLDMRPSKMGKIEDLLTFHSNSYVEFLSCSSILSADDNDSAEREEEFGLGI